MTLYDNHIELHHYSIPDSLHESESCVIAFAVKVLMITNGYPDYPGSYRGIFIKKLCLALKKNGLKTVVLCPRVFKKSPFFEVDEEIPVHRFWYPSGEKPLGQSGKIPILAMCVYMLTGLFCALKLIITEKPDIIHGHWIIPTGLIAAITGKLTGKKVINTAHGMDVRLSVKFPVSIFFKTAVWLSDKVTVVAGYMKKGQLLKNSIIIPCGIDESFYEVKADLLSKTVISTRSLEPVYNIETLIKAIPLVIKQVPEARLMILGEGSEKQSLMKLADSLGISNKVTFAGRVNNFEIPAFFKNAKVYVSTSLEDGTSVSLLEALASGLIPVVSDIEANRAWIEDGIEGFLFPVKNPAYLADKICISLKTEKIGIKANQNKIKLKDQVSWATISKSTMTVYRQLIKTY